MAQSYLGLALPKFAKARMMWTASGPLVPMARGAVHTPVAPGGCTFISKLAESCTSDSPPHYSIIWPWMHAVENPCSTNRIKLFLVLAHSFSLKFRGRSDPRMGCLWLYYIYLRWDKVKVVVKWTPLNFWECGCNWGEWFKSTGTLVAAILFFPKLAVLGQLYFCYSLHICSLIAREGAKC